MNARFDRVLETQRRGDGLQGVMVGEVHSSPISRAYVAYYLQERAEAGRPLSHVFVELSVDQQPLIDRYMRRDPGADRDLETFIRDNADYPDGFMELLQSARDSNTRIVAMDVPMNQIGDDLRFTISNPHWEAVIRREMAAHPDGQFMVLGGAGHNDQVVRSLGITGFTVMDVHGADYLSTYRREERTSPTTYTEANYLEQVNIPDVTTNQLEGSIVTADIRQVSPNELVAILPDIPGYAYENRSYMLQGLGYNDRSPLSADLDVYRRLNDILYDDTLNPRADSALQQILQRLAAPGQASTDVLQSQRIGDQIEHLADIGQFSPADTRALRELSEDVRER